MEVLWALAACAALNAGARHAPGARPPSWEVPAVASGRDAVADAGFLSLGMRRLAADMGFIRLIVYYGTPEAGFSAEPPIDGGGIYPDMLPRAQEIIRIDPRFSYAALYASGALAFNLGRPGEAITLLNEAIALDPQNMSYRSMLAAIGVKNASDVEKILEFLAPVLASPDCPTMIKSIAAYLNLKIGRAQAALALFEEIARTSEDSGYRALAGRMIRKIGPR